jgi:hypothetical protein
MWEPSGATSPAAMPSDAVLTSMVIWARRQNCGRATGQTTRSPGGPSSSPSCRLAATGASRRRSCHLPRPAAKRTDAHDARTHLDASSLPSRTPPPAPHSHPRGPPGLPARSLPTMHIRSTME